MHLKEIKTDSFTIRLLSDNIIETIVHDNTSLDVPEIREIKRINMELTDGKPYGVLVDSGMITSITSEARELSASEEFKQNTVAKALFARSIGHHLVARIYLKINRPAIKTKSFSTREEALEWLEEVVQDELYFTK